MTPEDLRQHSRAWLKAAMKLEEMAERQVTVIDGKRIMPSAAGAVVDLARAVSNSYAEVAGE